MLDFRNRELLFADGIWRARRIIIPNFVKISRSVTEILWFFEFSRWAPPQSWIFEIAKFYLLSTSRVARRISMPNFVKIGQSVAKILRFFDFLRWRPPPSWIVQFAKKLLANGVQSAQTHHCTKFQQNRSFRCGDIAISQIFKMAAAAILDFWNRKILLAIGLERVETHKRAKFR